MRLNPTEFRAVIKPHRHPHQVLENVASDVLHHRLAEFERQPLPEMQRELHQECHPEKRARPPHQLARVGARLHHAHRRAQQPTGGVDLHRTDRHQRNQPVPPRPVRPGVGEKPPEQRKIQRALLGFVRRFRLEMRDGRVGFDLHRAPPPGN
jgi:hypothetical protein